MLSSSQFGKSMELRKRLNKTPEFQELHAKLNDLGLYEKGMDLEQMRQVMGAVDESINETSFNNQDMEFALRESEREFESANIYNSTMICPSENINCVSNSPFGQRHRNLRAFSSPFSSPEIGCIQKITVVAEVHRELNWTPKKSPPSEQERRRLSRKRTADAISQEDSGVVSSNSLFETTSV